MVNDYIDPMVPNLSNVAEPMSETLKSIECQTSDQRSTVTTECYVQGSELAD